MTKKEKYVAVLPQAKSLLEGEKDEIAGMANLVSLIHMEF